MKNKSILMVEDNPDDGALIIKALENLDFAFSYAVVNDGNEALDYLFCSGKYSKRNMIDSPSVIFLDLNLPKISGMEVLKVLRQNESTKTLPIVILTSSKTDKDIASSYLLGANSFVVKPVKYDDFADTIMQVAGYWLKLNERP